VAGLVDIQTVSIIIASAGLFAAAVYYILQIRHQTRMRQMDLFMRLYLTWGSKDMKKASGRFLALKVKDYDDFVKKYGPVISAEPERERSQVWEDIDRIGWFFDGIGLLVHRKFVDIRLVDDFLGYGIVLAWEKIKPLVYGWRKQYNMPKSFEWFEYLANECKNERAR